MYRTCIFCSADLGSNDVLEFFPVGKRLAFDARKGRLWAVCPKCTRWNLAPIEERWEAVEEAEEKFRGSRMRVQTENIGMAKMPDGTRLIRVGEALSGELAAWRYGTQLVKRRNNMYWAVGAGVVTGGVILAGLPLIAGVGVPITVINPIIQTTNFVARERKAMRVVMKLDPSESPTGDRMVLRRRDLNNARLDESNGDLVMSIPEPHPPVPWYRFDSPRREERAERLEFKGGQARMLAARAMVDYNANGANRNEVQDALAALEGAGSAEAFIRKVGQSQRTIIPPSASTGGRSWIRQSKFITPRQVLRSFRGDIIPVDKLGVTLVGKKPNLFLPRTEALALEMALHDESERRAMEGELALLEDAWREAETIARIADALLDEPPED